MTISTIFMMWIIVSCPGDFAWLTETPWGRKSLLLPQWVFGSNPFALVRYEPSILLPSLEEKFGSKVTGQYRIKLDWRKTDSAEMTCAQNLQGKPPGWDFVPTAVLCVSLAVLPREKTSCSHWYVAREWFEFHYKGTAHARGSARKFRTVAAVGLSEADSSVEVSPLDLDTKFGRLVIPICQRID